MHEWTDLAASRQHRDDLLREAATRRLTRTLPGSRPRGRPGSLLHTIWWEMHRDFQQVSKLLRTRVNHERTRT